MACVLRCRMHFVLRENENQIKSSLVETSPQPYGLVVAVVTVVVEDVVGAAT